MAGGSPSRLDYWKRALETSKQACVLVWIKGLVIGDPFNIYAFSVFICCWPFSECVRQASICQSIPDVVWEAFSCIFWTRHERWEGDTTSIRLAPSTMIFLPFTASNAWTCLESRLECVYKFGCTFEQMSRHSADPDREYRVEIYPWNIAYFEYCSKYIKTFASMLHNNSVCICSARGLCAMCLMYSLLCGIVPLQYLDISHPGSCGK